MQQSGLNSLFDRIVLLVGECSRDERQLSSLRAAMHEIEARPVTEIAQLLDRLTAVDSGTSGAEQALETVLQSVANRWQAAAPVAQRQFEIDELISPLTKFYESAAPNTALRCHILRLLALGGSPRSLQQFAAVCADHPPAHNASLALAFAPLICSPQPNLAALFPRILDGLQHPALAAAILDLTNHAFASGRISPHPAQPRGPSLESLLGRLVDKLTEFEQDPPVDARAKSQQVVGESVALAVSICRTLGLLGENSARANLLRANQLKHRRIRAEAAGALAQLGDPQGAAALLELAQWPVSRLRALAYADELGLIDQIDPAFRSEAARAEGELAVWLAEPTQFGVAPSTMELVDERELFWPGYDEPQRCYLFRFVYPTAQGDWSNIGIAGPATHAASASLERRSREEIYALFAGWQAVHDDVYEIEMQHLKERQHEVLRRRQADLESHGYTEIQPAFMGWFFGDEYLIASAREDSVQGHLIWGDRDTFWLPDAQRDLSSELAYCIFKGQKLLGQFNPEFQFRAMETT